MKEESEKLIAIPLEEYKELLIIKGKYDNIYKFILSIIINEDSMYDFREISKKVLYGIYDYDKAYNEWKKLGHIVL